MKFCWETGPEAGGQAAERTLPEQVAKAGRSEEVLQNLGGSAAKATSSRFDLN